MSSVRDRIRDLQHSESKPDAAAAGQAASVSKIARALDAPSAPAQGKPAPSAAEQGIGARVRRFNATTSASPSSPPPARSIPASRSLQPGGGSSAVSSHGVSAGVGQSSVGQAARRTASDTEDGRVSRGRTGGEGVDKSGTETHVGNARRKFESRQNDGVHNAASTAHSKVQVTTKKTTEIVTTVYSRASALETAGTYGVPTGGAAGPVGGKEDSSKDGKDAVSARAAIFGKPEQSQHKNAAFNGTSTGAQDSVQCEDSKHLKEELAEARALTDKLAKSLLDLTEQYCRLEKTRDNLQKRVAELEANAK